ncbi:hypothetical protein MGU_11411 [Metarhizium guizhouense ARSEF 977]|uniref:Rhodopsin domain-containing protein n=1 Tax=Metarhizium guizhouense (strain ARSEF 977) TaxID=1276136 RepID=A0A0B4G3Q6_METGA|nr:hypothetical protein MGU_11411 [Metarhizium guizhouense ARSEF 977]
MPVLPRQKDPSTTPLVPAPEGYESNFINPVSRANQYYIVAGICTALMTILVLVRLHIRFFITYSSWWDDLTVVIALLSQAAYTAVIIKEGSYGLGRHAWDVTVAQFAEFERLFAIPSAILTAPAIYFTKLTLLLLYLRLFSPNRPVKIGIWAGVAFCTVFYTAALFLNIFVKSQEQLLRVTYSIAVVGVVTDVYIITLPMFAIAQLHLSSTKKWRVAAVFLTGLLGVTMSFLGCVYRFQLNLMDSTHSVLSIYMVNTVEVDIGIICTCLPLLGALFKSDHKDSWWMTSFRSLRSRLLSTGSASEACTGPGSINSGALSHNRAQVRSHPFKYRDCSLENIELVAQTSAASAVREETSPPLGSGTGIERKMIIEQWGGSKGNTEREVGKIYR